MTCNAQRFRALIRLSSLLMSKAGSSQLEIDFERLRVGKTSMQGQEDADCLATAHTSPTLTFLKRSISGFEQLLFASCPTFHVYRSDMSNNVSDSMVRMCHSGLETG